jgi:hypothetical protein
MKPIAIVVLVLVVCATALVIAIGPEKAWCTLRGGNYVEQLEGTFLDACRR